MSAAPRNHRLFRPGPYVGSVGSSSSSPFPTARALSVCVYPAPNWPSQQRSKQRARSSSVYRILDWEGCTGGSKVVGANKRHSSWLLTARRGISINARKTKEREREREREAGSQKMKRNFPDSQEFCPQSRKKDVLRDIQQIHSG
ncbi:hypothetical protein LZ31DRAFT_40877 [Colletotrichum somersetense]|nr:hypothetical protein LZ31DRAFT_40877 [Colletotrichum somersetense]